MRIAVAMSLAPPLPFALEHDGKPLRDGCGVPQRNWRVVRASLIFAGARSSCSRSVGVTSLMRLFRLRLCVPVGAVSQSP